MSVYRKIVSVRGTRYTKDKKFIGKDSIPDDIFDKLQQVMEVDDTAPAQDTSHDCLFCGLYGKNQRVCNGQTVALCNEHYYSENLGRIAQRIRENNGNKTKEEVLA